MISQKKKEQRVEVFGLNQLSNASKI